MWGFPQIDSAAVGCGAVELNDMYFRRTSFPQIDSAAVSSGAVELDDMNFRRTNFPPDKFSAGREGDYIWLAPLASSSVCAPTVTGSLLAGSPHRFVWFRLYSVVLSLHWIDNLDISRESPFPQKLHLGTTDRLITPDIYSPTRPTRVEIYLLLLREIVLLLCSFCRAFVTRVMASDRSPDMDQVGPSYAPSAPLPGTLFGPSLDISSEKLYDLAPDIPDVMGLRALRPSAAVVKVMSVPDSRCIRVVTPDDHVNIGFHEILLHDMGEEELPFVATSELDYLRKYIQRDLGKHIAFYHIELAQLWRCPVMWCTVWKGTIDTLLFSRIGVHLCHRYRIISRTGSHAAFRGTYLHRLRVFLEESNSAVVRRLHRQLAQELAARVALPTDSLASVPSRSAVGHRTVSRSQRPRRLKRVSNSAGGAESSC